MKLYFLKITLFLFSIIFIGCKQNNEIVLTNKMPKADTTIQYATGFSITNHEGFSIVIVTNPWPKANKKYTYILKEKNGIVPDSLQLFTTIQVPIQSIVVTSTTHIPSLEMLGVENSLIGFPHLDYISSEKVRSRIEQGKIKELGNNQFLNTEILIDLQPQLIMGYGIDNNNPTLDNLQKSGIKVLINGDWNESTPLGKAEWIKLFGALYDKQNQADAIFSKIENDYLKTFAIAKTATEKPTVLIGDIFESKWYLPSGTSWSSLLLKEANADYLWKETTGTGSLSLSFEAVFEKAKEADFWITSGQFSTLEAMNNANPHYKHFKAFQNKKVYSYTRKKGKTGGVLYYELGPNRPDIVLKDLIKILHPDVLIGYEPYFFTKLN